MLTKNWLTSYLYSVDYPSIGLRTFAVQLQPFLPVFTIYNLQFTITIKINKKYKQK